jgi:hypothetical protein
MDLRHRYGDTRLLNAILSGSLRLELLTRIRDSIRDRLPRVKARTEDYRRRNTGFMRAALEVARKSVFFDATKIPARILFLLGAKLDLRVVHIVRDPRAYCYSARRHRGKSATVAGREWVEDHATIEQHLRRVPRDRWIRIRYEDVCRDPELYLSKLTEFAGAGRFVVPDDISDSEHHIIGNAMRKSPDRRRRIRLDESWKRALSNSEIDIVTAIAADLAGRYGYDL